MFKNKHPRYKFKFKTIYKPTFGIQRHLMFAGTNYKYYEYRIGLYFIVIAIDKYHISFLR